MKTAGHSRSAGYRALARFLNWTVAHTRHFKLPRPTLLGIAAVQSLALWFTIAATIWAVVGSYPQMLAHFGWDAAIFLLAFSLLGSIVQLPGIGGGTQVLMFFGLSVVFHASPAEAASGALLTWLVSYYAVVPAGIVLAMSEGLSWRRLKQEAHYEPTTPDFAEVPGGAQSAVPSPQEAA